MAGGLIEEQIWGVTDVENVVEFAVDLAPLEIESDNVARSLFGCMVCSKGDRSGKEKDEGLAMINRCALVLMRKRK
jgi:hypothetical protein